MCLIVFVSLRCSCVTSCLSCVYDQFVLCVWMFGCSLPVLLPESCSHFCVWPASCQITDLILDFVLPPHSRFWTHTHQHSWRQALWISACTTDSVFWLITIWSLKWGRLIVDFFPLFHSRVQPQGRVQSVQIEFLCWWLPGIKCRVCHWHGAEAQTESDFTIKLMLPYGLIHLHNILLWRCDIYLCAGFQKLLFSSWAWGWWCIWFREKVRNIRQPDWCCEQRSWAENHIKPSDIFLERV